MWDVKRGVEIFSGWLDSVLRADKGGDVLVYLQGIIEIYWILWYINWITSEDELGTGAHD